MNPSLDQLLKFTNLLHQYRTIERSLLVHKSDQNENDVEHSFTLAMLAWHIHSTYKLDLDLSKLFSYALAHDLVEIYAGDTFFYQTDADVLNSKHNKEQEAARRLRSEFPEFPELHDAIDRYEAREDDESKFIYALDKIEPVLSIYLDGGRTWKKNNVTLEMLTSMKMPKVAVDKTIEAIFKELVSRIETDKDNLFNA
ncbi:MAG TPA: HD domain-containing protein [Candidatus Paceibacterota bacterium]